MDTHFANMRSLIQVISSSSGQQYERLVQGTEGKTRALTTVYLVDSCPMVPVRFINFLHTYVHRQQQNM